MIPEAGQSHIPAADNGASDLDSGAPARRPFTSSPLRPQIPEPFPRSFAFVTVVAVLVLAGMAKLTGAPDFIGVGLFAVAVAGLLLIIRAFRIESRTASIISENSARNQAEIETLADRMWELQESEERFRGLIDAL